MTDVGKNVEVIQEGGSPQELGAKKELGGEGGSRGLKG